MEVTRVTIQYIVKMETILDVNWKFDEDYDNKRHINLDCMDSGDIQAV